MKLWHDDIRPAPEGWVWARTNDEAKEILLSNEVTEISMDHDLGMHHYTEQQITENPELIFGMGRGPHTGLDLVEWMVETGNVPSVITIHSWNPWGAKEMAETFNDHGHNCTVQPFDPNRGR